MSRPCCFSRGSPPNAPATPVWALVKGLAVNHDGHRKAGLVAASPAGIAAVVGKAYRDSGISPASVGYIEAHGTGTLLGDALEIVGLTEAFRPFGVPSGACGLGSVKALMGHAEAAAGLGSLFSAILALRHGVVAPTLDVRQPNPQAPLEGSPFFLADRLRPWPTTGGPRRAGVNGFGLGGTNAHVILEAGPAPADPSPPRPISVLALAAPTEAGLRRMVDRYQLALGGEGTDVTDLCATATAACQPEVYRAALVFRGRDHLSDKLLLLHHFWGDWVRLRPSAIFCTGPERAAGELARRLAALPGSVRQAFRRCCQSLPPGMSLTSENGSTEGRPLDDLATQALFEALAECFTAGGIVDWTLLAEGQPRRRVPLPTYPFERRTYRIDVPAPAPSLAAKTEDLAEVSAELTHLWKKALEVEEVDPDESFFNLGGTSLRALPLQASLRERFGVDLEMADLFAHSTLRDLARLIAERRSASGATTSPPSPAPKRRAGDETPSLDSPQTPPLPAPALVEADLPGAEAGTFAQHSRPLLMERLAALRLDRAYVRARGDYLFYRRGEEEVRVLDLVGGYGSTLFGHNHPDLVARARAVLDANVPVHVQGSDRRFSGELARELSRRVGEYTGRSYVTTFASTGAEVIEVAIKHAQLEFQVRVEQHQRQGLKAFARLLHAQGHAPLAPGLREQLAAAGVAADDLATAHAALEERNAPLRNRRPAFLALRRAFHGKTSGAGLLSYNPDFRMGKEDGEGLGVVRVDTEDLHSLREAVAREAHVLTELAETDRGEACLVQRPWCLIAGAFVEPIQGEGGVRLLSPDLLAELRLLADQHGFPIIVDEVQSGMGRCGTFTAAEAAGLRGDYYALGKSLGGGLAKIAALLVDRERYVPALCALHTSTFADDDPSALIALRALEVLDRDGLIARAAARGADLLARLRALARAFPEVIADVRGRGCLLGLELADPSGSPSALMRHAGPYLGMLAAGYLLAEHDLRVMPTTSAPSTLRLEPSAYLTDADVEHCLAALTQLCTIIRHANAGRLIRHLVSPEERLPQAPVADFRNQAAQAHDEPGPGEPRIAFLTYFVETADLAWWDPSLAEIPREWHEEIIRGLGRVSEPSTFARTRVRSATGRSVLVELMGFMINSDMLEQGIRDDDLGWLREKIDEAVQSAVEQGVCAIGFGGYLSILTHNATRAARPTSP